jgi:hypothetical protein
VEPSHADNPPGRIPPRAVAPQPDQSAARAAAFRRILDEQTTYHDETTVMPAVPGGPAGPPGPTGPTGPIGHAGPAGLVPPAGAAVPAAAHPAFQPGPAQPPQTYLPGQDSGTTPAAPVTGAAAAAAEPTQGLAILARRDTSIPARTLRDPQYSRDLAAPPSRAAATTGGPGTRGPGRDVIRAGSGRGAGLAAADSDSDSPPEGPTRHSAGNRPGRLPAAIGVGAALAMIGGLVLILTNGGLSPNPTAPAALPGVPTRQIVIAVGSDPGSLGSAGPRPSLAVAKTTSPAAPPTAPAGAAPTGVPDQPAAPPTPTASPSSPTPTSTFQSLDEGSSGQLVFQLQSRLQQAGYMLKSASRGYGSVCESEGWDSSGNDENQTTDAIYQFQRNYDDFMGGTLPTDGVCDYATWQALFNAPARIRGCYDSG